MTFFGSNLRRLSSVRNIERAKRYFFTQAMEHCRGGGESFFSSLLQGLFATTLNFASLERHYFVALCRFCVNF